MMPLRLSQMEGVVYVTGKALWLMKALPLPPLSASSPRVGRRLWHFGASPGLPRSLPSLKIHSHVHG